MVSKKTLKNKLDKACSEQVRAIGVCARCGKTDKLQCAHIFSRSNLAVRWDFDNMLCLCAGCHMFWAHKNPIEFAEFVKTYLGEEKYIFLRVKSNIIKKWTIPDMEELLKKISF